MEIYLLPKFTPCILVAIVWVGILTSCHAQDTTAHTPRTKPPVPHIALGVGLTGSYYSGDLTQHEALQSLYPGVNFSLQFANSHRITPELNLGFGQFAAQDASIPTVQGVQPNTFVQTSFIYFDLRLKGYILKTTRLRPYVSVGIGVLQFTPKDARGTNLTAEGNTRLPGETYSTSTTSYPLSLGVEYKLNQIFGIGLEYTYRPTGTLYLDNIGKLGKGGNDALNHFALRLYIHPGTQRNDR